MNFNCWYIYRLNRVKKGDACVCIGSGVDDYPVYSVESGLNLVNKIALMVGLV